MIPKRAPGRPTLYSPQLGQRIAARLTARVPLSTICAGEGVRSPVDHLRWRRRRQIQRLPVASGAPGGFLRHSPGRVFSLNATLARPSF
jgi:hypothetical protein